MTYDLKSGHFCIKSDRVMTRNSATNSLKVKDCCLLNYGAYNEAVFQW